MDTVRTGIYLDSLIPLSRWTSLLSSRVPTSSKHFDVFATTCVDIYADAYYCDQTTPRSSLL